MDVVGYVPQGKILSSNGYIEEKVHFPASGYYQFDLRAMSSMPRNSEWARTELRVDGIIMASMLINRSHWETFSTSIPIAAGMRRVAIAFVNDYFRPTPNINSRTQDLNLFVDKLVIARAEPR